MKIELGPGLDRFVADKLNTGEYLDASEVIRDSLRRWKEHEVFPELDSGWLEQELLEGLESADLPASKGFWSELRDELRLERHAQLPGS
jgi:putative addiction module CopG family antidote